MPGKRGGGKRNRTPVHPASPQHDGHDGRPRDGHAVADTAPLDAGAVTFQPVFALHAPEPGQWLQGRYELRRRIGRGGLGEVWQARDHELEHAVALKFLPVHVAHDPRAQRQLKREAQAAIKLSHPHIVKLLHFHANPELTFLEMEYVDGPTLDEVLLERGPQSEAQVREWLLQICGGLAEAHRRGVIHLDLKPANLMLADGGVVKIADFSISRIVADSVARTTGHVTSGTLPYMPPEQLRGETCDVRSDLYALGVTAYELLRGRPPFHSGDIYHQHLHEPPPSIAVQAPLLWPLIARLLAKRPADRFQSVQELAIALEASAPAAEVPLAVMFTDIGGSTALHDALGDAGVRKLIRDHEDLVRAAVAAHDGQVVKTMGDGFMVAFEDVTRAVACAVAVQREMAARLSPNAEHALQLRIGLNHGRVLREGRDVFGQTVNVAARITAKAQPGQILVGQNVRHLAAAPAGADFVDGGLYHLKGVKDATRLFEVVWSRECALPLPRVPALKVATRQSPFVGRDLEMRELDRCLELAVHGQGTFVALSGEPGVGKTRLAREFLAFVQRRPLALTGGRCFEELTAPWQPVVEAVVGMLAAGDAWTIPDHLHADLAPLAAAAPELRPYVRADEAAPARFDAEEQRVRLLGALANLFVHWAERSPLVLLLDDAQWADQSTLDFLTHLGRRLVPALNGRSARVLVLATCRETELDADHPLNAVLTDLERDRLLQRVPVRGLGANEVATLLRALRGADPTDRVAGFVFHRSQGNPYFVEEIFRDLAEQALLESDAAVEARLEIPEEWTISRRVKEVIDKRLGRLGRACVNVLRTAALIGTRFRYDVLRAAVGLGDDEVIDLLEEALAARVVREAAEEAGVFYMFEHALAAEALSAEGSIARRQRLHLKIVDALEQVYGDAVLDQAAEVAQHLLRAGTAAPPRALATYATAAGEAALARYGFADAAKYLAAADAALAKLPDATPLDRARLQFQLFTALGHTGHLDRAIELANASIATFEKAEQTEYADRARFEIASILRRHTSHTQAQAFLEPFLERARHAPSYLYARALINYVASHDYSGHAETMLESANYIYQLANELGNAELKARALGIRKQWLINHTNDFDTAVTCSRRLVKAFRRLDDEWQVCRELGDLAWHLFLTGRVRKALLAADEAVKIAERTGTHYEIVDNRAVRAACYCFRGEWEQVDEEWATLTPHLKNVPGVRRLGLLIWARVRTDLWLGRSTSAAPSARNNYADMPLTEIAVLASLAYSAVERGRPGAREQLVQISQRLPPEGTGVLWLIAAQSLAGAWASLKEKDHAGTWYRGLTQYPNSLYVTLTPLELGRVAGLNGWHEEATRHFASATRLCRREGLKPLLAATLYEKALTQQPAVSVAGERRARALLIEARQIFAELGMTDYVSSAEGQLS